MGHHYSWDGWLVGGSVLGHSDWVAYLAVVDDCTGGSCILGIADLGAETACASCYQRDHAGQTACRYRKASKTVGGGYCRIGGCDSWNKIGELSQCSAEGT